MSWWIWAGVGVPSIIRCLAAVEEQLDRWWTQQLLERIRALEGES
jgi:hypothetical protein